MKVNIDQGTAALLAERLADEQDPGLRKLGRYIDQKLEQFQPSPDRLTADELQALIQLTYFGCPVDRAAVLKRARLKLKTMLQRLTDPVTDQAEIRA